MPCTIFLYPCEEVLILHNNLHPPPPILPNDAKVGRCKICIRCQHLEIITKPHSVCQLRGGGGTRDLCSMRGRGREGGRREGREGGRMERRGKGGREEGGSEEGSEGREN